MQNFKWARNEEQARWLGDLKSQCARGADDDLSVVECGAPRPLGNTRQSQAGLA